MKDYKKELTQIYGDWQYMPCPPESKIEFLGRCVFNFTTYDDEYDTYFAQKMIEVLDCILNKKTYDYIADTDRYINYLTMINMEFLSDKLDWGTSVRGAWLDDSCKYELNLDLGTIIVEKGELTEFVKQLIEWVK